MINLFKRPTEADLNQIAREINRLYVLCNGPYNNHVARQLDAWTRLQYLCRQLVAIDYRNTHRLDVTCLTEADGESHESRTS